MKPLWRVSPRHRSAIAQVCLASCCALLVAVAGCSSNKSATSGPSSSAYPSTATAQTTAPGSETVGPTTSPSAAQPTTAPVNDWSQTTRDVRGVVEEKATWHTPVSGHLTVDNSDIIGLTIGRSDAMRDSINELLPNTKPSPGGKVRAGQVMSAQLQADPNDADVTPKEARNESTDTDINLLWTWNVHPKRPLGSLVLIAHLEVHFPDTPNVVPTDKRLEIPVHWTFGYISAHFMDYADKIANSWVLWAALGGLAVFFRERIATFFSRIRGAKQHPDIHQPPPTKVGVVEGSDNPTEAESRTTSRDGGDAAG